MLKCSFQHKRPLALLQRHGIQTDQRGRKPRDYLTIRLPIQLPSQNTRNRKCFDLASGNRRFRDRSSSLLLPFEQKHFTSSSFNGASRHSTFRSRDCTQACLRVRTRSVPYIEGDS